MQFVDDNRSVRSFPCIVAFQTIHVLPSVAFHAVPKSSCQTHHKGNSSHLMGRANDLRDVPYNEEEEKKNSSFCGLRLLQLLYGCLFLA
ncbi:hypothetical protein NPIL_187081 [Nephila pilipes]|uniref:Uncharacterized protein n=1 Tax=Nephila pilipes TaxID=299642 RepID=A0A8X6P8A3_NEPPI|nr:hypothetical protein NPIL_187081 [Nephila pilipes]